MSEVWHDWIERSLAPFFGIKTKWHNWFHRVGEFSTRLFGWGFLLAIDLHNAILPQIVSLDDILLQLWWERTQWSTWFRLPLWSVTIPEQVITRNFVCGIVGHWLARGVRSEETESTFSTTIALRHHACINHVHSAGDVPSDHRDVYICYPIALLLSCFSSVLSILILWTTKLSKPVATNCMHFWISSSMKYTLSLKDVTAAPGAEVWGENRELDCIRKRTVC